MHWINLTTTCDFILLYFYVLGNLYMPMLITLDLYKHVKKHVKRIIYLDHLQYLLLLSRNPMMRAESEVVHAHKLSKIYLLIT